MSGSFVVRLEAFCGSRDTKVREDFVHTPAVDHRVPMADVGYFVDSRSAGRREGDRRRGDNRIGDLE